MSNQKLIRVKNGDQSTSFFTTDFNPPILVPEKSSIALQNLSLKLRPNLVNIDDTVNQFSYATVKTTAGGYNQLIAEHKSILPNKIYTISELIETINSSANSKLFYSSSPEHTREQGAEILFNIDSLTNKTAFHFVARAESEFCAPVPTAVATNGYTYTTSNPTNLYTIGNILRGQPTVTKFDTYFTTTNVFCRGSGEIRFDDNSSGYQYPGVWSNGDIFTTNQDLTIADSGLQVGEVINFENTGEWTIQTLAQGGNNNNKLVITMTQTGATDGADTLRDASLTAGYMVGLIESNELKLTTADEILSRVTYGVMVLNKENTYGTYDPGVYYIKRGRNLPWESTNLYANNDPTVKIQLGRHESPNDQYKIRIIETYGNNISRPIADFDYTYGNFVMLASIMKNTSALSELRWTESKITKGTSDDGYYSTHAPDLSLRENNFVDVANAQPDENVQYFGNSDGYAVLDWLNLETASVYGYYQQQNTSSNIKNSSTLTVIIPANLAINAQYGFPESIVCKLDLPLESYDDGLESHVVAFIPNIVVNDKSLLVYTPSPPIYINLKNATPMYLDHLTVRLENEDNSLLDNQETCSAVLLIASK